MDEENSKVDEKRGANIRASDNGDGMKTEKVKFFFKKIHALFFYDENILLHARVPGTNISGYNYAISPCRFFLRLLGAWPDPYEKGDWFATTRLLLITTTMFNFATLSQTIKILLNWSDLNLVTEILSNCDIPTSIATVKIASLWYHRHVLRDLLRQIIQDWEAPRVDRELTVMWRYAKISRLFSLGCIFMTETTLLAQCIVGFLAPISYAVNSNISADIKWPLYMKGYFPYNAQLSPNYELTLLGQFLSNVFASTSFSSADSFFVFLMCHLIGQLSILKMAIIDLPNNKGLNSNFLDSFSFILTKHNRLWRFSLNIEQSFNMMFLIQMVPCIFALCTQGYQLITISGAESISVTDLIFMIYFLVLFLFTIFTYCYIAEILREKSVEISHAAYNCDWTVLSAKDARLLVFIIVRAQSPFEITVGKFASFSLQLYCRILKTSAGYLSMLLAVKDRAIDATTKITV